MGTSEDMKTAAQVIKSRLSTIIFSVILIVMVLNALVFPIVSAQ